MLSPLSDVLANITLAHCDAVGRGHPLHQFSVAINTRILAYENLIEEQDQAMFVAASFGQNPIKSLQEKQTAIRIYFEPLRTETF